MATKEAEAPSGKKVVTNETILEQESDSAPGIADDYDPVKLENTASEMGHSLGLEDVASTELDWSDMAPAREFDNPNQPPQEEPQPQPTQEQPQQLQEDVDLTDSMRKRISGIKEKSTQELAEKDALIAARDNQIAKMKRKKAML
jgi:hypothetical protein